MKLKTQTGKDFPSCLLLYQRLTTAFLTFYLAILSGMSAVRAASYAPFTVIADGLHNPRGLSVSSDGSLYVTETGVGGNGDCIPPPSNQGDLLCYGTSGTVTQIKDGQVKRIIKKSSEPKPLRLKYRNLVEILYRALDSGCRQRLAHAWGSDDILFSTGMVINLYKNLTA